MPRKLIRRGVVLAGFGLALIGPGAPLAAAADAPVLEPTTLTGLLLNLPDQLLSWTDEVTKSILPGGDLAPGETVSSVVGLRNETDDPVRLSLQTRDVEDGGQLGDHLRFTISRDPERDGTFESEAVFSGTLQGLAKGIDLADVELLPHSAWDYRVEVALDENAGNEVAGDAVSFSFVWKSTAPDGSTTELLTPAAPAPDSGTNGGETDVLGQTASKEGTTLPVLGTLPITGSDLALLLGAGSGLVLVGAGLRLLRREAMSL